MKNFISCILCIIIIFSTLLTAYATETTQYENFSSDENLRKDLAVELDLACEWLINSPISKDSSYNLYFLCLGTAGKPATAKVVSTYISSIIEQTPDSFNIDAIQQNVLNATFCGYDATNIADNNLVEPILNFTSYEDQSLLTLVYALLALDANDYAVSEYNKKREELVELILNKQHQEGSFYDASTNTSKIVLTAISITALSNYCASESVTTAVDKAVEYLAEFHDEEKLFAKYTPTCTEVASTIVALKSLNISLTDSRFIVEEDDLLDYLFRYVNLDSGFGQRIDSISDEYSTENAILALSAVKSQKNPYILTNKITFIPKVKETIEYIEIQMVEIDSKNKLFLPIIILIVIIGIVVFLLIYRFKKHNKK